MHVLEWAWALLLLHYAWGNNNSDQDQDDPLFWAEGEWCRTWAHPSWVFWCPRYLDQPGNVFCCGTCNLPYCCSEPEDRLNQQGCLSPVPTSIGPMQNPRNNPPPAPGKTSYSLTIFFSFVSFLLGITFLLVVRHCKEKYGPRLRSFWHSNMVQVWNRNRNQNQDEPREMFQTGIYHLPTVPEPIPDPFLRPLPPNVTIMPPNAARPQEKWAFSPSALADLLQSASFGNMEGEGASGSLVHRHVPSQASDTPSEKETSL
ncbi:uncharacterized protein LOC121936565 [Sceloporus undulatus]|uniref:uncharacterized protein LOC121936565 n=1 Tax=Sceloporus undulatus TaxID=8520 RepID=UPI001C4AA88B|nr:uncharacterized protein LOC121936565 [Sceloporus undulatus]